MASFITMLGLEHVTMQRCDCVVLASLPQVNFTGRVTHREDIARSLRRRYLLTNLPETNARTMWGGGG